ARARHLYTQAALGFCREQNVPGEDVFGDSVAPVLAAGLADVVAEDADLGDGLRLDPTPGHTPGHVSLSIESGGEVGLITGDFMHHPVQFAEPRWAQIADVDAAQARDTRQRLMMRVAESGELVIGTHFAARPAGRVVADGTAWRYRPL
ncbi:MAG: MBL fold metallo-hydrolase, partial [Acidimicrobiia bacterium]